jgi:hypothetical protein
MERDGLAGSGMILRDYHGQVIFAATRVLFNCLDPLQAEFVACK